MHTIKNIIVAKYTPHSNTRENKKHGDIKIFGI